MRRADVRSHKSLRADAETLSRFRDSLTVYAEHLTHGEAEAEPVEDWRYETLDRALRQEVTNQSSKLSQWMFSLTTDFAAVAQPVIDAEELRQIEQQVDDFVASLGPSPFRAGGARRFLVAVDEAQVPKGLVESICDQLPGDPTVISHDRREMIILCEAERIPIDGAAKYLVNYRADLLQLAERLPTRVDVTWYSP